MEDNRFSARRFALFQAALYVVVILIVSWWFADLRFAFNRDFPLATPQMLVDGTAYQPFQFRVLIPWLATVVSRITGGEIRSIYQAIEAVFAALLVFSFYFWLRAYFSGRVAVILSLVVLPVLSFNLLLPRGLFAIWLPYDVSSAMFFALLSALIVRGKWKLVWLVFPLAVLNRESVIFLVAAFALSEFKQSPVKEWGSRVGLAVIIWVVVKTMLSLLYSNNPGTAIEWTHVGSNQTHLQTNLNVLTSPSGLFSVAASFGFLWVIPLLFFRKIRDRYVRAAVLMFAPYFAVILLIGNVHEIRVYAEWAPVVLMATLHVLLRRRLDPDHIQNKV